MDQETSQKSTVPDRDLSEINGQTLRGGGDLDDPKCSKSMAYKYLHLIDWYRRRFIYQSHGSHGDDDFGDDDALDLPKLLVAPRGRTEKMQTEKSIAGYDGAILHPPKLCTPPKTKLTLKTPNFPSSFMVDILAIVMLDFGRR